MDGKMAELLKAHARKSASLARADAHQIPPTDSRSATSRKTICFSASRKSRCWPRVSGVCDTVLTQNPRALTRYGSV